MKYSELAYTIQELEYRFDGNRTMPVSSAPVPSIVYSKNNYQFFAVDSITGCDHADTNGSRDYDLPVIITVGANYGQGGSTIPNFRMRRFLLGCPSVEANDLATCRRHLNQFLKNCTEEETASIWESALSKEVQSEGIETNAESVKRALNAVLTDYHLVMTNLTPWITKNSWTYHRASAEPLIVHGILSGHLDSLWDQIGKDVILIVGHGDYDVYSAIKPFLQGKPWGFTNNLSQPKRYT